MNISSRKTKIIATIGPSSESPEMLTSLFKAGVDVCRLNFSFGGHDEHLKMIRKIRAASKKAGKPVAILQDLQGPKIRVGKLNSPVTVKKDDIIILSGNSGHDNKKVLPTTYTNIADDTEAGKIILLADGTITLMVTKTERKKRAVHCRVINGGTISTGKGINLPYTKISLPSLTAKDKKDAVFGAKAGVDYIALSFVRTANDVIKLRKILKKHGEETPIIAKIEKPEALDNIEEIIDAADGIMVARGDLAVEISIAHVPVAQKKIIGLANQKGKITITATQMLETMIENPVPTRAEASDVANAILDGTDAIMLSGETAIGRYPEKVIKIMTQIAREIESSQFAPQGVIKMLDLPEDDAIRNAICAASSYLSYITEEKGLAVFSSSGMTVRILSKFRPQTNIYAASNKEKFCNRMALLHNVCPVLVKGHNLKSAVSSGNAFKKELLKRKLVKKGDKIIILTGGHDKTPWQTDTIKVRTI